MKEWRDLGVLTGELNTVFGHLNKLGGYGWELVGPPNDLNAVFTYKAANDTWHDRACWVQRDFWLKRQAKA